MLPVVCQLQQDTIYTIDKMKERHEEEQKVLKMAYCVNFMEVPSVPVYH